MAAVGGLSGDRRRCTDRRKMSTVGAFGNGPEDQYHRAMGHGGTVQYSLVW